jgi:hypothetical protein
MPDNPNRLLVLWTNGDKQTSLNMVFMYSINARLHGWWDEVVLLLWGSPSALSAVDAEVQDEIARAKECGVRVIACKKCAENLGVVGLLEQQGIEVFYTGEFLTDWLKSGDRVLSV